MIRTINRKSQTIKIRSKKSTQSNTVQITPNDEGEQWNAERYMLQVAEKNIQSLQNQRSSLQNAIFDLKKENSHKENQIKVQNLYLREKEEKIKRRQIELLPYLEEYHKSRFSNEQIKQKNKLLTAEIEKIKHLLTNSCNELEKINTDNCFNFNDTFEVYQLEQYSVERLQSKIQLMKSNTADSHQKIKRYQQTLREYENHEIRIQELIEDTQEKLLKIHEKCINLKIQSGLTSFDSRNQLALIEILESKIHNIEELLQSKKIEDMENQLIEAQKDYEDFINEIDEKKKLIFQKQKAVTLLKGEISTNKQFLHDNKDEKINESEIIICDKEVLSSINQQLSNRSKELDELNDKLQAKHKQFEINKLKFDERLIEKVKKIDSLTARYKSIKNNETEILFQNDKINDFKDKLFVINAKLMNTINKQKGIQSIFKNQEEKFNKLHEKAQILDQKENDLLNQEVKLKEKNKLLVKKECEINSKEQQTHIKESNIKQLENEAKLLKERLTNKMKKLENELLVTPFHEKIGLAA